MSNNLGIYSGLGPYGVLAVGGPIIRQPHVVPVVPVVQAAGNNGCGCGSVNSGTIISTTGPTGPTGPEEGPTGPIGSTGPIDVRSTAIIGTLDVANRILSLIQV